MSTATSARRGLFALGVAFLAAAASAQEPASVPAFPVHAEAITVDVVVLDKDGHPIRGLQQADFTILEDGKPQQVVGFEMRDLAAAGAREAAADAALGLPRAEGETADQPGRTLGFIVDDSGLDQSGVSALEALRRFVVENADPRDEITLATTSGLVRWHGLVGAGRGELLAAVGAIRCRRDLDAMTHPVSVRALSIVRTLMEIGRGHAADHARKPVFILTQEGYVSDVKLRQMQEMVDAAQRGNLALYVLDTRGLVATGKGFEAAVPAIAIGQPPPGPGPPPPAAAPRPRAVDIDIAGAEHMARETGGALIRDTNDLDGRLVRAVEESSAYYLVGFQPSSNDDGKWHTIEVKVTVKGATVRSRRGYYASRQPLSEKLAEDARPKTEPAATAAASATQPPALPAAPGTVPVFASQAEAITVDVVVVDKSGHPVLDLAQNEFTLFEDGRQQSIVGFEPRALAAPAEPGVAADLQTGTATNEDLAGSAGRTLAFLIDDLGIDALHVTEVGKAIARWLTAGADPRDQVTVTTTSGDAWWSDTVGSGRADFEAVLGRLKGKKQASSAQDSMSDWEAYRIDMEGPGGFVAPAASAPTGGGNCQSGGGTASVRDRVVDRWFGTGACLCEPMAVAQSINACRGQVQLRATEVYRVARQRAVALLGGVERLSRGLTGARGRKSIIVLSEGLLRDTQQSAFESAVDASRHGNTAVSFVDVRGLVALSFYGADQMVAPAPGDVGTLTAEATRLATAGGEYLAQTTGGSMVSDTNDLAGSVARLSNDSSAYYLLGYQSERPLDGKWRKLEVKVSRPGVKVRARRGYFATTSDPLVAMNAAKDKAKKQDKRDKKDKKGKGERLPERLLDPALAVGGSRDGIPLRIAPYVMETDASGTARIVVAVEVGTTKLTFGGSGGQRTAQLDVTILGVSRDHPRSVPIDSHVELGVDSKAVGGWWMFSRELRLPAGAAQIRALVRDTVSGRSGVVAQRIEVPPAGAPYLSTPIISDRITPGEKGKSPQIMPVAHRSFPPKGYLYCAYEVYVAPGREMTDIPHVAGSYSLEGEDGRVVASAPPTPIAIALGAQIVRVHAFPLDRLPPGRYRLTIQAADQAKGVDLQAHETFVVERTASAELKPD